MARVEARTESFSGRGRKLGYGSLVHLSKPEVIRCLQKRRYDSIFSNNSMTVRRFSARVMAVASRRAERAEILEVADLIRPNSQVRQLISLDAKLASRWHRAFKKGS